MADDMRPLKPEEVPDDLAAMLERAIYSMPRIELTATIARVALAVVLPEHEKRLQAENEQLRAERDALKAATERTCERLDWLIANGFGATTDSLVDLRAALDTPSTPESPEEGNTR